MYCPETKREMDCKIYWLTDQVHLRDFNLLVRGSLPTALTSKLLNNGPIVKMLIADLLSCIWTNLGESFDLDNKKPFNGYIECLVNLSSHPLSTYFDIRVRPESRPIGKCYRVRSLICAIGPLHLFLSSIQFVVPLIKEPSLPD